MNEIIVKGRQIYTKEHYGINQYNNTLLLQKNKDNIKIGVFKFCPM